MAIDEEGRPKPDEFEIGGLANWEEVPDEDLWQDGELNSEHVMYIIYHRVVKLGTWKLIRRIK